MPEIPASGKQPKITVEVLRSLLREVGSAESEHRDPECPGLRLRIRPRAGGRWSFKGRLHGREKRWDLGPAVPTREGILDARERAARIRESLRRNVDPGAPSQQAAPIVLPPASWDWEAGVEAFLVHLSHNRRPDTLIDYRRILRNTKELEVFHGRRLAEIEREDIAEAIRAIHDRGVESHAAHVLRVVRSFWTWLSSDGQQRRSLVTPNLLYRLQAPERTIREEGDIRPSRPSLARKSAEPKLPSEVSLGRTLAIAESGALDPLVSLAIGLLFYTAQRRRAVFGALRKHFRNDDPGTPDGTLVWNIPPFFRKTARRRRVSRPHRLPLVGSAAIVADAILELEYEERNQRWRPHDGVLFPVSIPENTVVVRKSRTLDPGTMNHNLLALPGVDISPHGVRRAFLTYGKKHLGFTREEAKLILDHNEGRPPDATEAYDWDEEMNRKLAMLSKWGHWLDGLRDTALAADPMLRPENKEELAAAIRRIRYRKDSPANASRPRWGGNNFDEDYDDEI